MVWIYMKFQQKICCTSICDCRYILQFLLLLGILTSSVNLNWSSNLTSEIQLAKRCRVKMIWPHPLFNVSCLQSATELRGVFPLILLQRPVVLVLQYKTKRTTESNIQTGTGEGGDVTPSWFQRWKNIPFSILTEAFVWSGAPPCHTTTPYHDYELKAQN